MFSYNSTAIVFKNIFNTQISRTTAQSTTAPLTINALSNRILDTEIETSESADYSDISHCKWIFSLFDYKFSKTNQY